jgi:aspartyl-tRNA(Asn)/glutamyl-tRNA(Gln) amidotransferase subunit A
MTDLADLDATGLLAAYAASEATPEDALAACVRRIDDRDGTLGAFVLRTDEQARAAAAESTRRWKRGEARPLEGVPFGVKDIVATAGVTTSGGSLRYRDWVPAEHAVVVQRLLDAGAVLTGKLATPEFAFGDARDGHRPANPWNADHWTGGSSSGSAVALAAGMVPLAVGTDTGGSIRVPASYCGVSGLKPTIGRVPTAGVMQVSWTLDHTGPMARSVRDLALAFGVMAATEMRVPVRDHPLRVGIPGDWYLDDTDPEVLAAMHAVADRLRDSGASVETVATPHGALAGDVAYAITVTEFALVHSDWRDHVDEYTATAAHRLRVGSAISASDYAQAFRKAELVCSDFDAAFERVDVILSPATPTPAPRIAPPADPMFDAGDRMWLDHVARNFLVHNVTGLPAVVVRSGLSRSGLPLGVQFVGRRDDESRLIAVAASCTA